MEPAAPPIGLPAALDPPRLADRRRDDADRHRSDRDVPLAADVMSILPWLLVPIVAGWLYWGWRLARAEWFARDIRKGLRVLNRDPSALRWELLWFKPTELGGQPLPTASRLGAEERYELLRKFQGVLHTLGYAGDRRPDRPG